jgi:hypothetical protein
MMVGSHARKKRCEPTDIEVERDAEAFARGVCA